MAVAIASNPVLAEAPATPAAPRRAVERPPRVGLAERRRLFGYPPVWLATVKLVAMVAVFLVFVVTPPAIGLQLLSRLLS